MRNTIPLQTEIIVQVAHRFIDAAPALTCNIHRYPVRSPIELERAIEEIHAVVWQGTLDTIHRASQR